MILDLSAAMGRLVIRDVKNEYVPGGVSGRFAQPPF
jgi:hypothetical protein